MNDDITYIGVDGDPRNEQNIVRRKRQEQAQKPNIKRSKIKISRMISKSRSHIINSKTILLVLIILLLYFFNPVEYIKGTLDKKREYYASLESMASPGGFSFSFSNVKEAGTGLWNSAVYLSGYKYYNACRHTMMIPMDGLITCQYDTAHQGIDISSNAAPANVMATADGTVYLVDNEDKKFGKSITIRHEINGMTIYSYYANLTDIYVNVGDSVTRGQTIATEGGNPEVNNGIMQTNGHHIHFEVRKAPKNNSGLNPNIILEDMTVFN